MERSVGSVRCAGSRRAIEFGVAAVVLIACSDAAVGPTRAPPSAALSLATMSSCGASFRLISDDYDELTAPYGISTTVDTVDVCEIWTGSDYQYQAIAVGSSDNVPGFVDDVQSVTYDAGNVAGYEFSGSDAAPAEWVAPTSFDFMYADDATRQASYDYPYYGVGSPDPATCTQPPCAAMSISTSANPGTPPDRLSAQSSSTDSVRQFLRHGLTRRGVRALVEDSEEISRSGEGYRRFRTVGGTETVVRSIDPTSQLLMEELSVGPADTMITRHSWKRVAGGYVRARSEVEIVEVINGRTIHNRSTISFQKIRITDPRFPILIDPEVRP